LVVEGKVSNSLSAAIGFLDVVEEPLVGVQGSDLVAAQHAGEGRIAFALDVELDERVRHDGDRTCFGTAAATCLEDVHWEGALFD
jgi:hypothetical protein